MLILFAWGTLLFYIGGHLVRDNDHPDHSSRELSKILAKLERLKQQNEDLRRMAESLRDFFHWSLEPLKVIHEDLNQLFPDSC